MLNSVKRVYAPFAVPVRVSQNGGRIKHYEQAKDNRKRPYSGYNVYSRLHYSEVSKWLKNHINRRL